MLLLHVALAMLAFGSLVDGGVVSPLRSGSNENQYRRVEGAEGGGQPQVEMARFHDKDATDRETVLPKDPKWVTRRNVISGDLHHSPPAQGSGNSERVSQSENSVDQNRNKRSYYAYPSYSNYQIPQFQSISAWRPSIYPLQRPYYIPVYGVDGRIPLYFPPQPFYVNPGTPPKNPSKPPYVGPTYLPPVTPTYLPPVTPTYLPPVTPVPPKNNTTVMPTDNRFGDNDDDDRPIWDNGNEPAVPPTSNIPRPSAVPTRKPASSGPKTFPPLVHKDGQNAPTNVNHLSNGGTPTTTAPPPNQPPGPSRCVWAIVSCCSTSSKEVSYNCFDQLGCSGPFWDVSPCETEYAKAAIESALNYYNSRA